MSRKIRFTTLARAVLLLTATTSLAGCIGIGFAYPGTVTAAAAPPGPPHTFTNAPEDEHSLSKENFIVHWGKPDTVVHISDNEEIWRYYNGLSWAGIMPEIGIPIPLLIPVKRDSYDVRFVGNRAKSVSYSLAKWVGGCFCPNNEGEMQYGFRAMQ